jgi:hypothetical protein
LVAVDFLADAALLPERFAIFAGVFFAVVPCLFEAVPAVFPAADARGFFVALRLAVLAFALPVFEADLDDFSRVFLDIRLPFVAFSRIF